MSDTLQRPRSAQSLKAGNNRAAFTVSWIQFRHRARAFCFSVYSNVAISKSMPSFTLLESLNSEADYPPVFVFI